MNEPTVTLRLKTPWKHEWSSLTEMPSRVKHPCNWPGCPKLTNDRLCDVHRKERHRQINQRRQSPREQGYTSGWARYSKGFRKRFPLCGMGPKWNDDNPSPWGCLGRGIYTVATEGDKLQVDHIKPVADGGDFWDEQNHQTLCRRCHSAKTMKESVNNANHG